MIILARSNLGWHAWFKILLPDADLMKNRGGSVRDEWLPHHGASDRYRKCLGRQPPFSMPTIDKIASLRVASLDHELC